MIQISIIIIIQAMYNFTRARFGKMSATKIINFHKILIRLRFALRVFVYGFCGTYIFFNEDIRFVAFLIVITLRRCFHGEFNF